MPAGQARHKHTRPGNRPGLIVPGQATDWPGLVVTGQAPGQARPEKSGLLASLVDTFDKLKSIIESENFVANCALIMQIGFFSYFKTHKKLNKYS